MSVFNSSTCANNLKDNHDFVPVDEVPDTVLQMQTSRHNAEGKLSMQRERTVLSARSMILSLYNVKTHDIAQNLKYFRVLSNQTINNAKQLFGPNTQKNSCANDHRNVLVAQNLSSL